MLISHKNKFIFIHNYKVAGTSIIKALNKHALKNPSKNHSLNKILEFLLLNKTKIGNKLLAILSDIPSHINAKELKNITPPKIWKNYFKFGFVRNPWDWQVSLYHYTLENKNHHQHELLKNKTFEEYIKWRVSEDLHLQKDFFYDKNGKCLIDFIGKIENIEEDFKKICNKINIRANLPHINKSKHKNYREYYNEETKNLINKYFAEDIKLFNYEF